MNWRIAQAKMKNISGFDWRIFDENHENDCFNFMKYLYMFVKTLYNNNKEKRRR